MNKISLYIVFTFFAANCLAQPNLSNPLKYAGITYFGDCKKPNIFYKPTPKVALKYKNGKPQLRLSTYEYTSINTGGNTKKNDILYYLEFELTANSIPTDSVKLLKKYLEDKNKSAVTLVEMPIANMTSTLTIKQINVAGKEDTLYTLKNGELDLKRSDFEDNTKWKNKKFQIKIDDLSYQILEHAFTNNLQLCSFNYSYEISKCGISDGIHGNSKNVDTLMVIADAFNIYIDNKYVDNVIEHIKLDANNNAVFAKMEILDYNFFEQTTDTVLSKLIRIKATGFSNTQYFKSIEFNVSDFSTFSKYITFDNRINIRKPFYYQVVIINTNEESFETAWIPSSNWFEALNITSINPK